MAAENEFLVAVGAYLAGAGLTPAPQTVGPAEPAAAADLPAIVLSLESTARTGGGLGERSALITGVLRVDVCAAPAADAAALSAAVLEALLAPAAEGAVHRLLAIGATGLGSVGAPEPPLGLRRRTARFDFTFESETPPPAPSDEVIRTITITTELAVATADRATGAIATAVTPVEGTELHA